MCSFFLSAFCTVLDTYYRKLREDAKTVPIIAMTANAFAEDIEKALAAGMNTHVCKPVDMNLLGVALSRLLG